MELVFEQQKSFSILQLKAAYEDLEDLRDSHQLDNNYEIVVHKMGAICQMILWGDKQDPDFFEYFCQKKGMELCLDILGKAKRRQVLISVISNVSKLLSNLTKESLQVILATPAFISFQNVKFNAVGIEVAEYYVNFLKILSQKIDSNSVHLIFNHKYPCFALGWQAIRFYNHPQTLIRTTCRAIVVTLAKMNEPQVTGFLTQFPFVVFYSHLGCFIKQHWLRIDFYIDKREPLDTQVKRDRLVEIIEDHHDIISYLQDLIKLGNQTITHCVINGLVTQALHFLYKSIISNQKQALSIRFVVYVLGALFKLIRETPLADCIALIFFGKYQHKLISQTLMTAFQPPASYSQSWNFKNFWDSFDDKIIKIAKQNYQNTAKKQQLDKGIDLLSGDVHTPKNPTKLLRQAWSYLVSNRSKLQQFQAQYQKLQSVYGLAQGPSEALQLLSRQIEFGVVQLVDFDENPSRKMLLEFMMSKDDSLVNLSIELFLNLMKNKAISKHVLDFCSLNPLQRSTDFNTRTNFQKLLRIACQVLKLQPSTYRLCTIRNAIQMVEVICKPYLSSIQQILTPQLWSELALALKLSVERVNMYFEGQKGIVSLVQLFQRCSLQVGKVRPKTLVSLGVLPETQESDLYDKTTLSQKEQVLKDFHIFFLLKGLLQRINLRPVSQFKIMEASARDMDQFAKYSSQKQIELPNDTIGCMYARADQKPQKHILKLLGAGIVLLEPTNSKQGLVVLSCLYHHISKLQILESDHTVLRIKLNRESIVELRFDNYKVSTTTKMNMEEQRMIIATFMRKQIDSFLKRSLEQLFKPK